MSCSPHARPKLPALKRIPTSPVDALVAALDAELPMVPVTDVFTGDPYQAALDGAGLIGLTFQALILGGADTAAPWADRRARGGRDRHRSQPLDQLPSGRVPLAGRAPPAAMPRRNLTRWRRDRSHWAAWLRPRSRPPAFDMCGFGSGRGCSLGDGAVRSRVPDTSPGGWLRPDHAARLGSRGGGHAAQRHRLALIGQPRRQFRVRGADRNSLPRLPRRRHPTLRAAEGPPSSSPGSDEVVMERFDPVLWESRSRACPRGWDEVAPGGTVTRRPNRPPVPTSGR